MNKNPSCAKDEAHFELKTCIILSANVDTQSDSIKNDQLLGVIMQYRTNTGHFVETLLIMLEYDKDYRAAL